MKIKKNGINIALVVLIAVLLIVPTAFARKGVGIVWDTQTEIVQENNMHCIQYGIYNPWDEDTTVKLSVSDELKDVVSQQESDIKAIPAETAPTDPVPVEICFKIKEVYPKDCVLGLFCKQTCTAGEKVYEGKVQATQVPKTNKQVSGSTATVGVSVPLKLRVKCNPTKRSLAPLYVAIIIIALGAIVFVLVRNKYGIGKGKRKVRVRRVRRKKK